MNEDEQTAPGIEDKPKGLWHHDIPEPKDVFIGELAMPGEWIVANIQTNSFWPITKQKVFWRNESFWIIPIMKGFYPAVAIKHESAKDRTEYEKLLMRFISNLSWVEGRGFAVEGLGGGGRPQPLRRSQDIGLSICQDFDLSYFPEPSNENALLALALMREGRSLNHPAYAFLSFFRVLEVAYPEGKIRRAWVRRSLGTLRGNGVAEAVAKLKAEGISDIGTHLFESGRCAIAHARTKLVVDPDDPSDMRRMQSELPIIRALAEKAIEEGLGVESSDTVYRKHLYELSGFKAILGIDTVDHLRRGDQIEDGRMIEVPDINIELRTHPPYEPLSNLSAREIGQAGKVLHIIFESKSSDVAIRFHLDFTSERLDFSLFEDLAMEDKGTADSAERIAEIKRFFYEYFANGQMYILNAETGTQIARKDLYIPLNMFLNPKGANAEMGAWKREAERRRERNRRYANEMARFSIPYDVRVKGPNTD